MGDYMIGNKKQKKHTKLKLSLIVSVSTMIIFSTFIISNYKLLIFSNKLLIFFISYRNFL